MNTTQFLYSMSNLIYTPELLPIILALIIGIILVLAIRVLGLYLAGASLLRADARAIEAKKHVLNDLILMKDIQSELEKEIEQATLKATFQN